MPRRRDIVPQPTEIAMVDLRICDVSEAAIARLRDKAARCGQSLEQYVKTVIERAAMERTAEERRRVFERWSQRSQAAPSTTALS
jgi:hypothetical protein